MSKNNVIEAKGTLEQVVKTAKQFSIIESVYKVLAISNKIAPSDVIAQCAVDYSDFSFSESEVIQIMGYMISEGLLKEKNGIYSDTRAKNLRNDHSVTVVINTVKASSKAAVKDRLNIQEISGKKISRSTAQKLMENSKGHFFTATFVNKKNQLRTINGQFLKDSTAELGYVKVRESDKLRKKEPAIRNVNLQTLEQLTIGGKTFQVG